MSFDDGDHWQSLRLNMPASSVRDLQVKDDDLIAGTHGRGYLILDDVTPLRQIAASNTAAPMHLYTPQTATRIRNDMNPPTPWPPDMATGENPPDGAVLDYYLGPKTTGPVTLEVVDSKGAVVMHASSTDPVPPLDPRYPDPTLWARPPRVVAATAGASSLSVGYAVPAGAGYVHGAGRGPGRARQHPRRFHRAVGDAGCLHGPAAGGQAD